MTWSIRFSDEIRIRLTWGTRRYAWDDLRHCRIRWVYSNLGSRRPYPFLVCSMQDGRDYEILKPWQAKNLAEQELLEELERRTGN